MSKSMLFLFTETPLHAGTGRAMGTVDLPIQRERVTGYPMIQSSGIKGRLRAHYKGIMSNDDLFAVFGPETDKAADYAGALSFGDARLLLFPVRSLAGVFAWVTSLDVLARFYREAVAVGQTPDWKVPEKQPEGDKIWVSSDEIAITINKDEKRVVLEEYSFTVENTDVDVKLIANWLSKNALPDTGEYKYWQNAMPRKLCILPQDAFHDFVMYATEVQTHIKLNPDKKTVETGALWTAESLPIDTLLYVPLIAQSSRYTINPLSAGDVLKKITAPVNKDHKISRINFGGDETTGQGFVALKFAGGDQ